MERRDTDAIVVLVRGGVEVASWALPATGHPDLDVADDLARLQLLARRLGGSIWLRGASPELAQLLELAGLGDVVPDGPSRQPGRQAEGLEQVRVEEVVVPDDPVA